MNNFGLECCMEGQKCKSNISENYPLFSKNQPTKMSMPGRPVEFHHQSPTDPYVSLSTHTARASPLPEASQPQADIER